MQKNPKLAGILAGLEEICLEDNCDFIQNQ